MNEILLNNRVTDVNIYIICSSLEPNTSVFSSCQGALKILEIIRRCVKLIKYGVFCRRAETIQRWAHYIVRTHADYIVHTILHFLLKVLKLWHVYPNYTFNCFSTEAVKILNVNLRSHSYCTSWLNFVHFYFYRNVKGRTKDPKLCRNYNFYIAGVDFLVPTQMPSGAYGYCVLQENLSKTLSIYSHSGQSLKNIYSKY